MGAIAKAGNSTAAPAFHSEALGIGRGPRIFDPKKGRKTIVLAEIKVEGHVQKPQAFYILQRSSFSADILQLRQSFIPKILQSVEGAPF